MVSNLPSLQTLWVHSVPFKRCDTALLNKLEGIKRLIISCSDLWAFMVPMESFSHIGELLLLSCHIGKEPWDEGDTFEQTLVKYSIANVFSRRLRASSIYIRCYYSWDIEDWIEMFRNTPTSQALQSFGVHCMHFTSECHVSSSMFDFLHDAAATLTHLTLGASHVKKRDGEHGYLPDEQYAYHKFDSDEMRARLAPLTSLRSVTLQFDFHTTGFNPDVYPRADVFAHMVPLLASFPPCLQQVTLSFANPAYDLNISTGHAHSSPHGGSWVWPELDLRPLVLLLQRYEQLEAVVFEGAEGTTAEERTRILYDLPELRGVIQFGELGEKEKIGLLA
ncbi:hypothetical protein EIP86_008155 [Pleurotus ostreatoroseus]|nr:hypothetical protein EIP86_008155 [Pleurotus ostreatoroseus]